LSSSYNLLAARACYEAGENQEARTYIDKTLSLDPECTDAHYYHGLLLREEGKRIEAVTVFLNVLKRDLLESAPIDKKELVDFENKVRNAIELADEKTRSMLKGTNIIVTPSPSEEQVCLEFDPRQVVYAEDIDPKRESYKKLWVFVQNFLRMGKSVNLQEPELLQIILDEILPIDTK
jgi:tetratricopeptide (TPR) repeat protein